MFFSPSFFSLSSSSLPVFSLNWLDVDVGDARLQPERVRHAEARDFVANDVERDGLVDAFAADRHLHLGAARPFEQVGDFGGGQTVGLLVVDFEDHVAGPQAGLIGGRSGERRHDTTVLPLRACTVMPTP